MAASAADEPPIDVSLAHYMEQRALDIAADKAQTDGQRATVQRLAALRATLMSRRDAFHREATARRHARGEIYSAARVAAINAMGSTREQMEVDVRTLYAAQPDAAGVLQTHARVHHGHGLVAARQRLRYATPDIAEAMRSMQQAEEAFARAWIAAAGGTDFADEMRRTQRSASVQLRGATRPMHFVSDPPTPDANDDDAQVLGKAWNRLDALAHEQAVTPLSQFIVLPDEPTEALAPCSDLRPTLEALIGRARDPATTLASRKAVIATLERIEAAIAALGRQGGRAGFEIDL